MYAITKEVYFCYGHRLMNHQGLCRHLHGHSVKAAITITAEQLDEQSMVCDFAQVRDCASEYINQHLDHNFLVHKDDPIIPLLQQNNERFMSLDEHPTAEVIAKMIFQYIQAKNFNVKQVTLWETASSSASYGEQDYV